MPTPDTETLAARLRAVERALTDEDTTPTTPTASHGTDRSTEAKGETEAEAATDTEGRDADSSAVERRLCRLEAAVQAFRAALDEDTTATPATKQPDDTEPEAPGTPAEPGPRVRTDADAEPTERGRPPRRVPDGGHWPDDLAPE